MLIVKIVRLGQRIAWRVPGALVNGAFEGFDGIGNPSEPPSSSASSPMQQTLEMARSRVNEVKVGILLDEINPFGPRNPRIAGAGMVTTDSQYCWKHFLPTSTAVGVPPVDGLEHRLIEESPAIIRFRIPLSPTRHPLRGYPALQGKEGRGGQE